jgi:hypothetical protein
MTTTQTAESADLDRQAQLREHLRRHHIGADERWDADTLHALHDWAHQG